MPARLTVVNPIAIPQGDTPAAVAFPLAPRATSLDGLRIGLFWNGKNQGDVALARTQEALAKLYEGATFRSYLGDKGGLTRYASEPLKERILAECDVLVGTTADCGSCTSWLMREMAGFEERGLPTASWVASGFEEDARFSAEVFGCPDLPFAVVPLPFTNGDPVRIAQMVDDAIPQVIEALTTTATAERARPVFEHLTLCADDEMTFEGDDLLACFDAMNARFVEHGWSDGLPLVPPTRDKVDEMVAASGRAASDVIGVFAPGMGIGTVEKIAANAVMAGATPAAMPVILAMAECVLDDAIGLRTWAMSTGPQAPIVMVSGPVTEAIGMNHGVCALGPGSVSAVNVAIGRTLRLLMMNVGHSYPGVSDMDTIGSSMKFSACVAENEARNPWAPFRVLEGYDTDESTVTVNVPYGVCELFDFQNHEPELLIESFATVTRNVVGSPSPGGWLVKEPADPSAGYPFNGVYHNVIMMCPEHAQLFANAGWTIDDIKQSLHERSRLPFRLAMVNKPWPLFAASHPGLAHLLDEPDTEVHLYPSAECFQVFVVGGVAGRSLYFHGGTVSATRPVRLPD